MSIVLITLKITTIQRAQIPKNKVEAMDKARIADKWKIRKPKIN